MRRVLRLTGNFLIVASLLGATLLAASQVLPAAVDLESAVRTIPLSSWTANLVGTHRTTPPNGANSATSKISSDRLDPERIEVVHQITRVVVPAIDLSAEVVQSDLVPVEGGFTWQVPAFKVGHAEGTAGAGEAGNGVLLGHVTSVHSGNVFQELDRVKVGDTVRVFSDSDEYEYRVVSTSHVPRSDSSVLQPTQGPSVSLITCTGVWLPTIWDYTERLVVHAELAQ